jgi:hypothetical protein
VFSRRMTRWVAAAGVASVLFLAGFVLRPGTAAQSVAPPQVSVGQRAPLFANILVKVPITITCAPRSPEAQINVNTMLEEAVSGRIAWGSSNLNSSPNWPGQHLPAGVACDNAPHSIAADILAETAGFAFNEGPAIVTVTVTVCTLQGPSQADCVTTTVGPRVITLTASKNDG